MTDETQQIGDAPRTVGQLRDLLMRYCDDVTVKLHCGWDWPIEETDYDEDEETLILFVGHPEDMTLCDEKYICAHFGGKAVCDA